MRRSEEQDEHQEAGWKSYGNHITDGCERKEGLEMMYEVDFLPVGDKERSGDAISLRYSKDDGRSWIVGVIDGGMQESGEALCSHIEQYYKTKNIDFMICTHPDQDHASGLTVLLDNMNVSLILMHLPWDHVDEIFHLVTDGRVTRESLRERLVEGHPHAYAIGEKAAKKNLPIVEPFANSYPSIPNMTIVGPTRDWYLLQLIDFRAITEVTEAASSLLLERLARSAKKAVKWIAETWDDEKLMEPAEDATSSENNSGVITLFNFGDKRLLFTGDAGVPALEQSISNAADSGQELSGFSFLQVPHHGSKRNVGPSVLDSLLGSPRSEGSSPEYTAFISASKEGEPKHPSKRVVNALIRRGAKVIATQGSAKLHHSSGTPNRPGWTKATPLSFYSQIEEED